MKRRALFFRRLFFIAAITLMRSEAAPAAGSGSDDTAGPPGKSQKLHSIEQTPDGLAAGEWENIRAAYEAGRHAFHPAEGGWQARNPGQGWTMQFDQRGFVARPAEGAWTWGLELKSYGCGEGQITIGGTAAAAVAGQRLTFQRDALLQEWYVNDQRGLEHGFTISERPDSGAGTAGRPESSSAPLSFLLGTRGSLVPRVAADARGVLFHDTGGAVVLNYSGLKVWDADGKVLPSHFEAEGARSVRLVVDERAARYPVTVDPIAQQAYLKASNTDAGDAFGRSVAVSGDIVVVGAPEEDSTTSGVNSTPNNSGDDVGAAYIFARSGAGWTQQAYLKASDSSVEYFFGRSVAVSENTVVVGAPFVDGSAGGGAAYVFVRKGSVWTQQGRLTGSNAHPGDRAGESVAVSGDTIVIGASGEDSSTTGVNSVANENAFAAGAAYVFTRNGTTWSQQAYLKAGNTGVGDNFGLSVAVSGETIVVGAPYKDSSTIFGVNTTPNEGATDAGAAYVFVRSGATWTQQAYFKATNTGAEDYFGYAVAVSGGAIVIGAPLEDSSSNSTPNEAAVDSGAAYTFVRNGAGWNEFYLKASNIGTQDDFGNSVAVSGDRLIVGAQSENGSATGVNGTPDEGASFSGAAYLFVRGTGAAWAQAAYLKAANPGAEDYFGHSVAISGDTVVVGADFEDSSATGVNGAMNEGADGAGAACIFSGAGIRGANGALKVGFSVLNGVDLGQTTSPASPTPNAFIIGGGGWAANEAPVKAADQSFVTVYGNNGGTNSGLAFSPAGPFDQITFYTRGSPQAADPILYQLWKRSIIPDSTTPPAYLVSSTQIVASGALLPPFSGPGAITVKVPVTDSGLCILSFPDLRGPAKEKMQIAEISLERTAPRWDVPAFTVNAGMWRLQGVGTEGQPYTFYKNDSLSPTGWISLGNATAAAGGKFFFNDTPGASPRRFYRIIEGGVSIAP